MLQLGDTDAGIMLVKPCGGSLFVCYDNSTIKEWRIEDNTVFEYRGLGPPIISVAIFDGMLWATDYTGNVITWDLDSRKRLTILQVTTDILVLFQWNKHLVFACQGWLGVDEGMLLLELHKSILWNNYFTAACSWGERLFLADGNTIAIHDASSNTIASPVTRPIDGSINEEFIVWTMVVNEESLFTGDQASRVNIWIPNTTNRGLEYTLVKRTSPRTTPSLLEPIRCLIIHDGFLWALSGDDVFATNMTNEQRFHRRIQHRRDRYKEEGIISYIFEWRGAVFAHGWKKKPVRVTPYTTWSPSTHKSFTKREREGIRTMILLWKANAFPSAIPPMDILKIIFQYYATITIGEEFVDDLVKKQIQDKNTCHEIQRV